MAAIARREPQLDVYLEGLRFLSRDDLEALQLASRSSNRLISNFGNILARRFIASVVLVEDPAVPFHMTVRLRYPSIRQAYVPPTDAHNVQQATALLRYAYIEQFHVERLPHTTVRQSLATTQAQAPFVVEHLYYGSRSRSPKPLLDTMQCRRLKWHTFQPAHGHNLLALLESCTVSGITTVDFQRLLSQDGGHRRIILTDESIIAFVADCAARGTCALRVDYVGQLTDQLMLTLIQLLTGLPHAYSLCLDVCAPDQQLGIHSGLEVRTNMEWSLRIVGSNLQVDWSNGRLRITKNHSRLTQHCSCLLWN